MRSNVLPEKRVLEGQLQHDEYASLTRLVEHDDAYNGEQCKVKMFESNQKLIIYRHIVLWVTGNVLSRKLTFDTPIIDCFFTVFDVDRQDAKQKTDAENVLVVVFEDRLNIYRLHGTSDVINVSINIKNAFPTPDGIVITRKYDQTLDIGSNKTNIRLLMHSALDNNGIAMAGGLTSPVATTTSGFLESGNSSHGQSGTSIPPLLGSTSSANSFAAKEANFLTLSDLFGDLGLVVSSSTTSFGFREEITSYPSTSSQSIATTFNPIDKVITIYHVRKLSKNKSTHNSKRLTFQNMRKQSKRVTSTGSVTMNTPRLEKVIDDYDLKNMRIPSNPLPFDRMASGTDYSSESLFVGSSNSPDSMNYKKDVIFTKAESFIFDSDPKYLKILNVDYESKEAVIVVNLERHTIDVLIFSKDMGPVGQVKLKQSYTLEGIDATEFKTDDKHNGYIVVLNSKQQIVLCNVFYEIFSTPIQLVNDKRKVVSLDDCLNYNVSFKCADGDHCTLALSILPKDKLVANLIYSLKYLIHDQYFELFWLQWWSNSLIGIPDSNDWKLFLVTLLSFCIPDTISLDTIQHVNEVASLNKLVVSAKLNLKTNTKDSGIISGGNITIESDLLAKLILALHVTREDMKLNILAKADLNKLSILLAQLVAWVRWPEKWINYYNIDSAHLDKNIQLQAVYRVSEPPNVLLSLSSLFTEKLVPYLPFSVLAYEDEILDSEITPRTFHILRLFEILVTASYSSYDLVQTMVDYGITAFNLETYPPGIFMILKNTLLFCNETFTSHHNMSEAMITLIGRQDLLQFQFDVKSASKFHKFTKPANISSRLIKDIVNPVFSNKILNPWDGNAEAEIFQITKLLFSHDRRFYDATKILQTSRTQIVNFEAGKDYDDSTKLERQRYIASKVAIRTMTTPIGRGIVFTSSRRPLVTEGFPIAKMNFNTLFMPENITITLESVQTSTYLTDWGYFHNGVSSGLTVSKNFTDISGSWVVFNRPPVLNAQHAGFLLGLGLNGHLKKLEEWHIYNYLSPKHSFTSIAMLLGMAASLKGTMDLKLTKVLSIHVIALLPPGSTNLNVKLPVQTAGIIGIGLLYLETQHRRMAEMLLSQMCCSIEINDTKVVNEGYQLAAGIALGYVNLGKGNQLKFTNNSHLAHTLLSLGTSIRDVETDTEFDKSCCSAIMALMFIFLKTENEEIAKKLVLPETLQLIDYIRPDALILRSLAINMIMWNETLPTTEFVVNKIPACLREKCNIDTIYELDSEYLPYLNVLAGIILSIGIRYASSANYTAKETLLLYLDKLIILGSLEAENYDEKIALLGVRNARDIVCISASLVMAATGDIDVLKRLRYLHERVDENTNYGNYIAVNSAIGFLFLGGGQQSFRRDDLFSIAALITSVYPIYGTNNYDNHDMFNNGMTQEQPVEIYLQALRHFWALSVENRCLVVKNVHNGNPVQIRIDVLMKNGQIESFVSPGLLPELGRISKIVTEGTGEYLPVEFDFKTATEDEKSKFVNDLCLFVNTKRKYNKLKLSFQEIVELDEVGIAKSYQKDSAKNSNNLKGLKDYELNLLSELIMKSCSENGVVEMSILDFKRELKNLVSDENINDIEKMLNLDMIIKFTDKLYSINCSKLKHLHDSESRLDSEMSQDTFDIIDPSLNELQYLSKEFVNELKSMILMKEVQ